MVSFLGYGKYSTSDDATNVVAFAFMQLVPHLLMVNSGTLMFKKVSRHLYCLNFLRENLKISSVQTLFGSKPFSCSMTRIEVAFSVFLNPV